LFLRVCALERKRGGGNRPGQAPLAKFGLLSAAPKIRDSLSMLNRQDLKQMPEPAFFAPFVSAPMRVEPGWIDYNGHLNMAYYNVLFDRAVDEVYELLGCGLAYLRESQHSCFTAEVHLRYLRELNAGDLVRVTFQLLDFDQKRLHYFEELHHAEQGWLSATSENMALHVDIAARKTVPFPEHIAARLAKMKAAHAALPVPEAAGRRIAMPER
jgi:acyl-CoA thioester hydrolase